MDKRFSGHEILEIAVQIEKNAGDFYSKLADKAADAEIKEVFNCLAEMEKGHIDIFKEVSDAVCGDAPEGVYSDEYFAYMNALAGQYVFTEESTGIDAAEKCGSIKESVDVAIGFEKDSILFYEEIRKNVPEKAAVFVERIVEEEKKHLRQLCGLKGGCQL
ncbi:MAG: ferritin family protein [Candidatus Omnitrophica bacterium]|nr:ferritin family protein [Candidatus Omnitrophota bacterium]